MSVIGNDQQFLPDEKGIGDYQRKKALMTVIVNGPQCPPKKKGRGDC